MRNAVIVIPAYKPTAGLIDIIKKLKENNFYQIIVVNDGSSNEYEEIFKKVKLQGCVLLNHNKNKGKGEALKTGFKKAIELFDLNEGVITVDADNQHSIEDIVKISKALIKNNNSLIMGQRNFDDKIVPFKSKFGNKITAVVFKITTGVKCEDTQTGLRGIPKSLIDMAIKTHGSRYEYEYNFLLDAAEKFDIIFVPIKTIYYDDNKNSHFRAVKDSLLIYQRPLKFILSSLAGFLSDIIIFYFAVMLLPFEDTINIITATVLARILSGMINYYINKKSVFRLKGNLIKSSLKYWVLFLVIMTASAIGSAGLSMIITNAVLAKIIVDLSLFVFSYTIQKNWVFASELTSRKASVIWKSCATLFFVFYVAFTLLNRFIMPQNVVTLDKTDENIQVEENIQKEEIITEPIITDTSYVDENISVNIETIREFETDIYIAEIILEDSSFLKAGLAENSFGTNVKEKTSEIASDNNAIIAINGDYYGFRDYGYVLRNGYLYRDIITEGGNEDLVIYENGDMEIVNELDISANELVENGAVQIFSFGPGLISDGEIIVDENSEVAKEDPSNPRTAIAMIDENHYIFMVADGRTDESEGLSLEEMAIVLNEYGCEVAYNLDGGGSATMVFMGEVVNNPTTNGRDIKERSVSDIVYIG